MNEIIATLGNLRYILIETIDTRENKASISIMIDSFSCVFYYFSTDIFFCIDKINNIIDGQYHLYSSFNTSVEHYEQT